MRQPFTAVVGVENRGQYLEIAHADIDRRLGEIAVGVLMSEKTGLENTPNRHGPIYPLFEEVDEILAVREEYGVPELPVIIHYNTNHPERCGRQLVAALYRHNDIAAVQVNGLYPQHYEDLTYLKAERPEILIVVQVDDMLLDRYKHAPDQLACMVAAQPAIDCVWLDGSGGCGRLLDVRRLLPYIEAFDRVGVGVGVAGGLTADNVENTLLTFLEQYGAVDLKRPIALSWDSQSGVMDSDGTYRRFNTQKAVDFLGASNQLRRQASSLVE